MATAGTNDDEGLSRFNYRDLRLLSKSSVDSRLRTITLIDFDCFYAQCESVRLGLPPEQPLGVQQFKHVIAINYPARAAGLKKVVSAEEAKKRCPSIVLQHVPTWRPGDTTWRYRDDALQHMDTDKSSLDYYKLQSRKAMELLKETLPGSHQIIERAGIDETYVDLSSPVHEILLQRYPELAQDDLPPDARLPLPPTSVLDWEDSAVEQASDDTYSPELDWDDICLHIGSQIVRSIRTVIFEQLHYTCSAGIARNKVLAKVASGHNKPDRQTVVLNSGIPSFLSTYKFTKLRGLGRKLGHEVAQAFNTSELTDLLPISLATLRAKVGHSDGQWVYNVIRGVEYSEVIPRTHLKSVLSAKTFMPPITALAQAEPWLDIFAADIVARLEDLGGQRPRTIAVHVQVNGPRHPGRSKQGPVPSGARLDAPTLSRLSRDLLTAVEREGTTWPLVTLSVDVSNLEDTPKTKTSISSLLAAQGPAVKDGHNGAGTSPNQPPPRPPTSLQPSRLPDGRKRTLFDFHGFRNPTIADNGDGARTSKKPRTAADVNVGHLHSNSTTAADNESHAAAAQNDDKATLTAVYECELCQRSIREADVLEHLDWHAAVEVAEGGGGGDG